MVTIHDVAREAGVSAATVSRTFNENQAVGKDYARRVRAAAKKLGYQPNLVARSLRTSTSDVLTLIVPDIDNSFHTAIARGAEDVAQEAGYSVLLGNSDENLDKESRYIETSSLHRVAGVLFCPHRSNADIRPLQANGIPVVAIDRRVNAEVDTVMVSNCEGATQAVEHLFAQGWKAPAGVSGPSYIETHAERLRGYRAAVEAVDAQVLIGQGSHDKRGGYEATRALMESATPPDSFFVTNERLALGMIEYLREQGLRIGRDVGVVTFDDTPWAPLIDPPITVVEQPAYQMGAMAARMLIERLANDYDILPRRVELPTRLVVRESSKRPQ